MESGEEEAEIASGTTSQKLKANSQKVLKALVNYILDQEISNKNMEKIGRKYVDREEMSRFRNFVMNNEEQKAER